MESMANNVLFCQKCATPHQYNFPWIFWQKLRFDSPQCRSQLITSNIDILQQEQSVKEMNKRLIKQFQIEHLRTSPDNDLFKKLNAEIYKLKHQTRRAYIRTNRIKYVNCPNCNITIPRACRKCSFCFRYTAFDYAALDYPTKQRNIQIVAILEQGIYTLDQVGKRFKVSRERVRQVYLKLTGKNYIIRRKKEKQKLEIKRETEFKIKENSIKFYCKACKKPETFREAGRRVHFCFQCRYIQKELLRDPSVKLMCRNCNTAFNPQRNWKAATTKPRFCSLRCYIQSNDYMKPKRKIVSVDISLLLDRWYGRQNSFDAFYFKYRMQGLRPLEL